jgi:hypothetical protein
VLVSVVFLGLKVVNVLDDVVLTLGASPPGLVVVVVVKVPGVIVVAPSSVGNTTVLVGELVVVAFCVVVGGTCVVVGIGACVVAGAVGTWVTGGLAVVGADQGAEVVVGETVGCAVVVAGATLVLGAFVGALVAAIV